MLGFAIPLGQPEVKRATRRSMLYSNLYAVVQRRMPTLPIPRRSSTTNEVEPTETALDDPIAPESPPPKYTSRPVDSNASSLLATACLTQREEELASCSRRIGGAQEAVAHDKEQFLDGINWRLASQGLSLATLASQEATTLPASSSTLTRQLYLHGLTYLLRSLPTNLSQEELAILRNAAPRGIDTPQKGILGLTTGAGTSSLPGQTDRLSYQDSSVLQRLTATLVFHTFILAQFLLPYIKLFVSNAYRWEREHRVTKRVVNKSINTVDNLGRKGLEISRTVCQMNDGKVGQAINDLTLWFVQGVAGGIQQGISDGVALIAKDRVGLVEGRVKGED